jgi:hypothetical protein
MMCPFKNTTGYSIFNSIGKQTAGKGFGSFFSVELKQDKSIGEGFNVKYPPITEETLIALAQKVSGMID